MVSVFRFVKVYGLEFLFVFVFRKECVESLELFRDKNNFVILKLILYIFNLFKMLSYLHIHWLLKTVSKIQEMRNEDRKSRTRKINTGEWAQGNSLILSFLDKCSTISWPPGMNVLLSLQFHVFCNMTYHLSVDDKALLLWSTTALRLLSSSHPWNSA